MLKPILSFQAHIDIYDFGTYFYTVIYIPDHIAEQLPLTDFPRLRVNANIEGYPTKGALMPDRVGSKQTKHLLQNGKYKEGTKVWYLQTPKALLKNISKTIEDTVNVELSIGDQDEVDMHPAQEDLLAQNQRLNEIWKGLTPGKRRSLAYPILKAKSDVTLEKRLAEFEDTLLNL